MIENSSLIWTLYSNAIARNLFVVADENYISTGNLLNLKARNVSQNADRVDDYECWRGVLKSEASRLGGNKDDP